MSSRKSSASSISSVNSKSSKASASFLLNNGHKPLGKIILPELDLSKNKSNSSSVLSSANCPTTSSNTTSKSYLNDFTDNDIKEDKIKQRCDLMISKLDQFTLEQSFSKNKPLPGINSSSSEMKSVSQLDDVKPNDKENATSSEDDELENRPLKAPNELLQEFLVYVMQKQWEYANKLCKFILMYEPNNKTAKEFLPLIEKKLEEDNDDKEDEDDDDDDDEDDESDSDDEDDEEESDEETDADETDESDKDKNEKSNTKKMETSTKKKDDDDDFLISKSIVNNAGKKSQSMLSTKTAPKFTQNKNPKLK